MEIIRKLTQIANNGRNRPRMTENHLKTDENAGKSIENGRKSAENAWKQLENFELSTILSYLLGPAVTPDGRKCYVFWTLQLFLSISTHFYVEVLDDYPTPDSVFFLERNVCGQTWSNAKDHTVN